MNTYAVPPDYIAHQVKRVATGGRDKYRAIWRSCIHYVRRSNAWPGEILDGHPWQHRGPAPQEPHAKRNR